MRKALLSFLMCAVAVSACGGAPGKGAQGKTVALVDGEAITEADLRKEAEGLPPYMRPILETAEGRAQFLESVITRDLLLREAFRRGVDRRQEVADRLSMARKSILLEALLREVAAGAPGTSDDALRKLYAATPEKYRTGERVKVSHMLFRDRKRAEEMFRRAKAGEPFEELMKEVSGHEGEAAADLGDIERGQFVKEFEEAAFAASPGSVVGPVRTTYGYHVIKVYEKKPAGIRTFEEVRPQLLAEQRENAQREAFESLIAGLRSASTVRILSRPGEIDGGKAPPQAEGAKPAPGN
ncbi:MAG: peptidyl-prolyl cis-trans isomerase [Verrucomicrobiota bacterium]